MSEQTIITSESDPRSYDFEVKLKQLQIKPRKISESPPASQKNRSRRRLDHFLCSIFKCPPFGTCLWPTFRADA